MKTPISFSFSFSVTLTLITHQLLCSHLIGPSSAIRVPTESRVLPPQAAVVSGILSGPSAGQYGPFPLAPGEYTLFVEWITPGSPGASTRLALVSTEPGLQPGPDGFPPAFAQLDPRPYAYEPYASPNPHPLSSHLTVPPGPAADAPRHYQLVLADDPRFADARLLAAPTRAELRFWLFDDAQNPAPLGAPAGTMPSIWFLAVAMNAPAARHVMRLPAEAGPSDAQTGADLLLALGLARAP